MHKFHKLDMIRIQCISILIINVLVYQWIKFFICFNNSLTQYRMRQIFIKFIILAASFNLYVLADQIVQVKEFDLSQNKIDESDKTSLTVDLNESINMEASQKILKIQQQTTQQNQNLVGSQTQDMTETQKIALLREMLFEQAKSGNKLKDVKISDQDLYKQIDKHIKDNKVELLKNIQEKFNENFKDQKFQSQQEKNRAFESVIKGVAVGVAPLLINGLIMLGIYAIGFTTAGIAAGSIAAGIQAAAVGGAIQAGSTFAVLQGLGAVGAGIASLPVLIGTGIVLGVGYGVYSYLL